MDSFPLSDLNWAQKYICRIKNTGGTLHSPCRIHIQQLWTLLWTSTFQFLGSVWVFDYCRIRWIYTNIKWPLTLLAFTMINMTLASRFLAYRRVLSRQLIFCTVKQAVVVSVVGFSFLLPPAGWEHVRGGQLTVIPRHTCFPSPSDSLIYQ